MFKRSYPLLVLALFVLMFTITGVIAENNLLDEWVLDGTTVHIDAKVIYNPDDIGKTIYVRSFNIESSPNNLSEKGYLSINEGNMSILYQDKKIGQYAGSVHMPNFFMLDVKGWRMSTNEISGFSIDTAIQIADDSLSALGLSLLEPYCVTAWDQTSLPALSSDEKGFYMVYFPVQYHKIGIMPNQIHAQDKITMGGGRAVVGINKDQIIYIYVENAPDQNGDILYQGTIIPFSEAIDLYKNYLSELLFEDNETYDVFKIAYEYVPENVVGKQMKFIV